MASIQHSLFSWQAVESSPEIERFHRILDALDDETFMRHLEADRKGRRNDNPVRAMWNSLIAGMVFGHRSIGSLRAELMRNGELRQACGFSLLERVIVVGGQEKRLALAPSKHAYTRFLNKLTRHQALLDAVFDSLTRRLSKRLPDFGQRLAADGKAVIAARADDADAGVGVKKQGHPDDAEQAEITYRWLGYKIHMLCDASYELPVAFEVTNAAEHESPHLKGLLERTRQTNPELVERAETLCADKGYDDGADKAELFDEYGIAPLIPSRDLKGGRYEPLRPALHDTIYVSATGQVCCNIRPFEADDQRRFAPMQYMGFEQDRGTLKFRCPAAAWGVECDNREACRCSQAVKQGDYGRVVRVKIDGNRRLFGPVYAHSQRFADLYKMRTSVERLFARLDHMYGFERHNTVGLGRMKMRLTLALIAMQATAVGWIEAGRAERLRCLSPAA